MALATPPLSQSVLAVDCWISEIFTLPLPYSITFLTLTIIVDWHYISKIYLNLIVDALGYFPNQCQFVVFLTPIGSCLKSPQLSNHLTSPVVISRGIIIKVTSF